MNIRNNASRHVASSGEKLSEKQAQLHYNLGRALAKKGDLDGAIASLQRALEISPGWSLAVQALQDLQGQRQKFLEKATLQKATEHYHAGKDLLEKGEYVGAIACFRRAIKVYPGGVDAYLALANTLVQVGELEEAIQIYQRVLELKADLWEVHHKLGNLYRDLGRKEEAIAAYERSIELRSDFAWNYDKLADVLVELEEWQRAIVCYEKLVELQPDFAWGYYKLGDVCAKLERWDGAVKAYRLVAKLDGSLPEIYEKLGDGLCQMNPQNMEEICRVYQQAIEKNPDNLRLYYQVLEVNPQQIDITIKLADILQKQGRLEQSVVFYQRVLGIKDIDQQYHAIAWHNLGNIFEALQQEGKAIDAYRNSLKANYNINVDQKLRVLLEDNLWQEKQRSAKELESAGKLQDALFAYRRATTIKFDPLYAYYQALEENPHNYLLYLKLGDALVEREMFNHAIVFFKQGLKLKPDSLDINLKLGQLLLEQNKLKQAKVYFEQAIKIDSECFDGYYGLAKIQEAISLIPSLDFCLIENQDTVELTKESIWIELPIHSETSYCLLGKSASPQSPTNNQALIQFEFLDHNQKLIPQPYPGISISETLGPYFYISTNGEDLSEFKTKVFETPFTAKYVRLGFRAWHNKKAMMVSAKIKLFFDVSAYIKESISNYEKSLKIKPYDYNTLNKLGNLLEKQGKLTDALSLYRQSLEVSYSKSYQVNSNSVFNHRVLYPLHLSLPYQQTGYTIRSHHVLKSLQEKGINVLATTRLGYPNSFLPKYLIDDIAEVEKVDGIEYRRLKSVEQEINIEQNYPYIERYAEQIAQVARSHNSSVIHSASNFVTGMAGILAAKQVGIKSIYELRGFWYLSTIANGQNIRDSCWFNHCQLMESAVARHVDAVVTLSSVMKEKLIDWGIPPNKIAVIPNAVDIHQFKPCDPDVSLQKKLDLADYFVIGFIGSLNEYEGVDLLIQAVAHLVNQGNKIKLMIVGDGPAKESLKSLVNSTNIKSHVIFIDQVPFIEVNNYYALADVCVLPRRSVEVCQLVPPVKLLEAMAMAKPVVVSALPPLLEIVKNEETGLVCRPDDVESLIASILKIYNNIDLATELGQSAINWVKAHRQWSVVCQKYLEVYENLFSLA